ncbi:MAG: type IV pilus modification PilV family protein [Bacillota bacterium]
MLFLNKKAVTLVETLASIIIITFVFTSVLTIIVNVRKQTAAMNNRVIAVNVAKMIRDDIISSYQYSDINELITDGDLIITSDNCTDYDLTNLCDLFTYEVDGLNYSDNVTITFLQATTESMSYGIIHYNIDVIYFDERNIVIEGLIYE